MERIASTNVHVLMVNVTEKQENVTVTVDGKGQAVPLVNKIFCLKSLILVNRRLVQIVLGALIPQLIKRKSSSLICSENL